MAVTRERYEQGMTYDQYLAQFTRDRATFEANARDANIDPAAIDAFRKAGPLHVLVITEDWCGDALANVPLLARLAREAGNVDLRFFLRDQNDDLTSQYMNGEFKSIPVFVFFDKDFREIGHWIERPKSVTDRRAKERREIYASDPAFGSPDQPADRLTDDVRSRLQAALAAMRARMKPWADGEVVRELCALVTQGA
ncbi:MAG TPA: thioredoxin family protein [Candidatus Limnocylindria bacterium]|nr:thioredoxin family protein [Candidatus Limnocylindria bacterium]